MQVREKQTLIEAVKRGKPGTLNKEKEENLLEKIPDNYFSTAKRTEVTNPSNIFAPKLVNDMHPTFLNPFKNECDKILFGNEHKILRPNQNYFQKEFQPVKEAIPTVSSSSGLPAEQMDGSSSVGKKIDIFCKKLGKNSI